MIFVHFHLRCMKFHSNDLKFIFVLMAWDRYFLKVSWTHLFWTQNKALSTVICTVQLRHNALRTRSLIEKWRLAFKSLSFFVSILLLSVGLHNYGQFCYIMTWGIPSKIYNLIMGPCWSLDIFQSQCVQIDLK